MTVSNHTVNNTVTISLKSLHYVSVECYSSHENEEAKENLTVQEDFTEKEGTSSQLPVTSALTFFTASFQSLWPDDKASAVMI